MIKLRVAVRQLAGLTLGGILIYGDWIDKFEDSKSWWAAFIIAIALVAPEVIQELVKAWKEFKR